MTQFQERPKNVEPFITIKYNHLHYDSLVNLLQITIAKMEAGIDRPSLEGITVAEVTKNREMLSVYQSILKIMLDEYDNVSREAKHYRE